MTNESKTAVMPKLRFPEFCGSVDWKTKRMSSLYSFMRNNTLSRDKLNYEAGMAKNIHYGDIHTKLSTLFDITKECVPYINVTEDLPEIDSGDYCVEGDLVFADSSEDTNDVGKCIEIIWLEKQLLLAGQHTILARRKNGELVIGFSGHVFQSARVRSQIRHEAQGTKVYAISPTRLARIEIAYPGDEAEQQKIADCLNSLDELIFAQGRKVEALKTYKRGLMQQLFPREGESLPRLRFPEFQNLDEWVCEELSCCLKKVIDYRGKAPPKSASGVPLITARNVRFGWLDMTNEEYIEESEYSEWMSKGIPQMGDVLFTTEAPLANVALFPSNGRFALGQRLLTLRPRDDKCLSVFLFRSLLSPRMQKEIDFHSTGTTAKGIKSAVLVKIIFCYPGINEQRRIADFFTSLDEAVAEETSKLKALNTHKKGLMQKLFPSLKKA